MTAAVATVAPVEGEPFDAEAVRAIALDLAALEGPLLPILHAVNDRFGYIDEQVVLILADVLNLSRAEVHGVVTFYHDFRRAPAGRHVVKVCRAESCQATGARQLAADFEAALGIRFGETTADGRVTLDPVYCLGNCALSPAVMVDGELQGRVDGTRLRAILAEVER